MLHSFANTQSPLMKKRALQYMLSTACSLCHGKRLRPESLGVKFAGLDIADLSRLSLQALNETFKPYADGSDTRLKKAQKDHPEKALVTQRITQDLMARLEALLDLGLGYLSARTQYAHTLARRVAAPAARHRRCAPTCFASCTCWMSRRLGYTPRIPRPCSRPWSN